MRSQLLSYTKALKQCQRRNKCPSGMIGIDIMTVLTLSVKNVYLWITVNQPEFINLISIKLLSANVICKVTAKQYFIGYLQNHH